MNYDKKKYVLLGTKCGKNKSKKPSNQTYKSKLHTLNLQDHEEI